MGKAAERPKALTELIEVGGDLLLVGGAFHQCHLQMAANWQ